MGAMWGSFRCVLFVYGMLIPPLCARACVCGGWLWLIAAWVVCDMFL